MQGVGQALSIGKVAKQRTGAANVMMPQCKRKEGVVEHQLKVEVSFKRHAFNRIPSPSHPCSILQHLEASVLRLRQLHNPSGTSPAAGPRRARAAMASVQSAMESVASRLQSLKVCCAARGLPVVARPWRRQHLANRFELEPLLRSLHNKCIQWHGCMQAALSERQLGSDGEASQLLAMAQELEALLKPQAPAALPAVDAGARGEEGQGFPPSPARATVHAAAVGSALPAVSLPGKHQEPPRLPLTTLQGPIRQTIQIKLAGLPSMLPPR